MATNSSISPSSRSAASRPDSPPAAEPGGVWRLTEGGVERGPYGRAYVLAGLRTGVISPDTPAWPEGGYVRRPLREWGVFKAACGAISPPERRDSRPAKVPIGHRRRLPAFPLAGVVFVSGIAFMGLKDVAALLAGWDFSGASQVVSTVSVLGTLALLIYGLVDRRRRPGR